MKLSDLDFSNCKVIKDKYNRIDNTGVNHGRIIYFDEYNNIYYKIFNSGYVRRNNFIEAVNCGFYEYLAPSLKDIIYDKDGPIGYISEAGNVLSNSEFDIHLIPEDFKLKLFNKIKETGLFFYDFVPSNIIELKNGELSLIDLEI